MTKPPATDPHRILSASDVLGAFRDLGTDAEADDKLACDPSFNRYAAYWTLGETLDAGYAALEGMLRLAPARTARFVREEGRKLLAFLADRYDSSSGRFSTDSSHRTRGVFAWHSAIGVMKSLLAARRGENAPDSVFRRSISAEKVRAVLTEMGCDRPERKAVEAVEELVADCRSNGGLVENPESPLIPSLTALYTASSVLWNLSDETRTSRLFDLLSRSRVEGFVRGCVRRVYLAGRWIAGFSIHPDIEELCINTTSFGLRLAGRLELDLGAEIENEIREFLLLAYRDGGFSSTLWEPRSLNATFFGLRSLEALMPAQEWSAWRRREREAIQEFVGSCTWTNGGAAFTPDFTHFRENCLASRYRVQVLEYLGAAPRDGDTYDFFRARYNPRTGGFGAYPTDRVSIRADDQEWIEQHLAEKDDQLLSRFGREEGEAEAAVPTELPWDGLGAEINDLYVRLAELEEERQAGSGNPVLETRIDGMLARIESLERMEAASYRAFFDAQVARPVALALEAQQAAEALLARHEGPAAED